VLSKRGYVFFCKEWAVTEAARYKNIMIGYATAEGGSATLTLRGVSPWKLEYQGCTNEDHKDK